MRKNLGCTIVLTLALLALVGTAARVPTVKASETIYIRSDGSIDPVTANITSSDNINYLFTDDNYDSLVVQKYNVTVDGAGYALRGAGSGIGLTVFTNVTIQNLEIESFDTGVRLAHASNITLIGCGIRDCAYGLFLGEAWNITISGSRITNNTVGLDGNTAVGNVFTGNNITDNEIGVQLGPYSDSNTFYHNNFINNTNHAQVDPDYERTWDDGIEGNYWDEYLEADSNHDGIGDTAYIFDDNNTDHFPLMGPFHSYNTSLDAYVNVISNSSVKGFEYNPGTILFFVSNMTTDHTSGFCRVCIPYEVMSEPFNVTVDGADPTYWNYTLKNNGTHRWIYFEYEHSTREIVIIPESLQLIVLPLIMTLSLLIATAYRKNRQEDLV
ncbi:MAG: right-handed parallel beta-helix repeat-containing protein [Candidatus Bathyarchaeota archaeon]|nr:right-handed parallel beta-helix repeat-containing protein [Candidatus Bathyarchaeota archaeon]